MAAYLSNISVQVPPYKTRQSDLADFMIDRLDLSEEQKHQLKVIYRASGIQYRYSVLDDFVEKHSNHFKKNLPFPSVKERMSLYKKHALPLAKQALEGVFNAIEKNQISHLIIVSCTGLYAPGLDIELIQACGLKTQIERTAIQYMGCYAAFNALKVAKNIANADENAVVAIVSIELCSIHLQQDNSEDALLSNALFGDGAAAALVSSKKLSPLSLKLEYQYNDLYFEGAEEMSWDVGNHGFEMKLSSKVPDVIKSGIKQLTDRLLEKMNLSLNEVDYYAVHPGGKRILEVIQTELALEKENLKPSFEILKNYGNMSSTTILFVLNQLMADFKSTDHDKKILSFAFGPGLTMESLLMSIHVD